MRKTRKTPYKDDSWVKQHSEMRCNDHAPQQRHDVRCRLEEGHDGNHYTAECEGWIDLYWTDKDADGHYDIWAYTNYGHKIFERKP